MYEYTSSLYNCQSIRKSMLNINFELIILVSLYPLETNTASIVGIQKQFQQSPTRKPDKCDF